ncbi:MAG TPA: DUF432 domain-containing protein, partial [Draconibacterium sp.]|nr:DUF432 domain-containing protein [Draconibacterium sp.]
MTKSSIYGKKQLEPGKDTFIDCNTLMLGIKRNNEGWYLKTFEKDDNQQEINAEQIVTKGAYYHTGKSNTLVLAPALPAKPMVFKGSRMVVSPHQRLTFYVKVPLLLQVYSSKKTDENLLTEIPFINISDTWFGEPISGEAAFALESEHYLDIKTIKSDENFAICPVSVFNNYNTPLEIERLILRVDQMNLLKFNSNIITNLVKLEYKGKDALSSVNYSFS